MKYSEFCNKFYFNRNSTALAGCKSKAKIGEYFFRTVLDEVESKTVLPESDSTYDKYYRGTRNSEELWGYIVTYFDESTFCNNLMKTLKNDGLTILADKFGLQPGDEPLNKAFLYMPLPDSFIILQMEAERQMI